MFKASSFADPADVAAYHKWFGIYKSEGLSDAEAMGRAFKKGDNAIGCWGDDTSSGSGPCCAIPPEYMIAKWGSTHTARNKQIEVRVDRNGEKRSALVLVKDVMPHIKNIRNGARIDLNPDAAKLLDLSPPFLVEATWEWV